MNYMQPEGYAPMIDHPGDGRICIVLFQNVSGKTDGNARYLPQLAHRSRDVWLLRVLAGSPVVPEGWKPVGWRYLQD